MWTWIVLLLLGSVYWLYKWSTSKYNVFTEYGIPHDKPLPLLGNAKDFLKKNISLHKIMLQLYRRTKSHKIYGFYNFRDALFIVNDPKIIKKMAVKDFEMFANHQRVSKVEEDPILRSMLTVMTNQRWKDMRNTLTPCFTSAKMRAMFELMSDCFKESLIYIDQQLKGEKTGEIELKDCFHRLSNDLIATTAFGITTNSFVNKNNEFFHIGKSFTETKPLQIAKFILFMIAPKLFDLLGLQLMDQKKMDYFTGLVVDAIAYRKEHNIIRPDMIHLLVEAQAESGDRWSQMDIVAQCFIFFFAAFENNAKLLCTACHELALNPDIQNKLYEEIAEVRASGTKLDYDTVQKLEYMDMVVSETQRKWSLAAMLDRECGGDYTVRDEDGNKVCDLKKGDRIWFQTIGFHWDEEYFKDPEIFDPERFSKENKHNIDPFTYMPFGVGPRSCIGNRYALMQAKAMLFHLLGEYKLEPCERTSKNLMDDMTGFQIDLKNGFWVKLVKREQQ